MMQEPEPIDWEYYRKGIGAPLVNMYKEAYDSMYYTLPMLCSFFYFSCYIFLCMNFMSWIIK